MKRHSYKHTKTGTLLIPVATKTFRTEGLSPLNGPRCGPTSGCADPSPDARGICSGGKRLSPLMELRPNNSYGKILHTQERRGSRCYYSFSFFFPLLLLRVSLCCTSFPTAEREQTACLSSICPLLCKRFSHFPANLMFFQLLTHSSSQLCNYEPVR